MRPSFVCVNSVVGPLIGRHCGTKIPPELESSTGILSLTFHTDMAVAKDGFSARYNMTLKEVSDSKCLQFFALAFISLSLSVVADALLACS